MTAAVAALVALLAKMGVALSPELDAALAAIFGQLGSLIDQATSSAAFDATAAAARIQNMAGQLANDEANADGALVQKFPPSSPSSK